MRKLIAFCALLLSTSAAMAQTDKSPVVTKLPGEERLSLRERAERDFLMPIRHKKMAEVSKATAQLDEDATAAPELDATAHYTEAADARPEEVAVVTRTEHHAALRHTRAHRSVRHSSKASATKRSSKTKKSTAHRSTKTSAKATAHKTKTKTKTAVAHKATKKVSKTKKRRR